MNAIIKTEISMKEPTTHHPTNPLSVNCHKENHKPKQTNSVTSATSNDHILTSFCTISYQNQQKLTNSASPNKRLPTANPTNYHTDTSPKQATQQLFH